MPLEQEQGEGTMAVMKARLARFETEEGRRKGLAMKTRPSDIFVVTTPKAGTTWMQQIVYQLRSKGRTDFEEISAVVPWVELAHDQGQELEAEQPGEGPRLFKTHCWYDHCPKGGKYVVVLRDPEDVAVSFFRFFEGWFFEPGEIALDDFVREFFLRRGVPASEMQNASYWVHLVSWVRHLDDPDVLVVFFEDLKEDLPAHVRRIAAFMGYKESDADFEERVSVAARHSSFEWMSNHGRLFDEHMSKEARNEAMGLPRQAGTGVSKVRTGQVGAAAQVLSDEVRDALRRKWEEVVTPATGAADYASLRAQISWYKQQKAAAVR